MGQTNHTNDDMVEELEEALEDGTTEKGEEGQTPVPSEEYKSQWLRAMADYQNLQREVSHQRSEWAVMSELAILEEFLPVYSNFKKAFASEQVTNGKWQVAKEVEGWLKGIGFIMKQFGDILKSHGIEEIKTVGEQFDPTKHEIVGEEESELPEHTIVREVDTGFVMKEKVIKVAKVVVVKAKN